ncbi:hypothetical protein PIB30_048371 [Stylosanthes scabra]|uniref:Secreted protein n=1 Tax=Stylosanthes scabra TaxID=79078 RepID=A0ABU6VJ14_9FABA|nr:hypothetical protein [Stylosanthes scabra]
MFMNFFSRAVVTWSHSLLVLRARLSRAAWVLSRAARRRVQPLHSRVLLCAIYRPTVVICSLLVRPSRPAECVSNFNQPSPDLSLVTD